MDDSELIAATAGGDAEAFAVLYRRHLPRVVGFALRATGDPEVAADLTAEVFAAALASCARYRPHHDSAAPWLLGIAQNKLRESWRRDGSRTRLAGASRWPPSRSGTATLNEWRSWPRSATLTWRR